MPVMSLEQAYALAVGHMQAGRSGESESLFRQILKHQPDHAPSLYMLGQLEYGAGRNRKALELIQIAIALEPGSGEYHGFAGLVYRALNQPQAELDACQKAAALRPDVPVAHFNLGTALAEQSRYEEAILAYRQAVSVWPDFADAWHNLGHALQQAGQLEEAALALERAITAFEKAPGFRKPAIDATSTAIDQNNSPSLRPGHAEARWNLAWLLLQRGDYPAGWAHYEARRQFKPPFIHYVFSQPQWDGSDPAGKRILLHAEQGFGDMFQVVRYAALLASLGTEVILESTPPLTRLFAGVVGVKQVVERGQPLPAFDLHCPIMSLPGLFGTTVSTIPHNVPYIHADPQLVEVWRQRLAGESRLKVGLIWSGRPKPPHRSIPAELLSPLSTISGVQFYSLQKSDADLPAPEMPKNLPLIDWTSELRDFADTAALLMNLDLLITIDTASAHLAGALGQPVWVLLQQSADWRWLLSRDDSPWYPTMRLFRQIARGDWQTPLQGVVHELSAYAGRERF